jgi:tagaturonate reductase
MKGRMADDGNYYGEINGQAYKIEDESAAWFTEKWATNDTDSLVDLVLKNEKLWNADLSALSGFAKAIKENINLIQKEGVVFAINSRQLQKTTSKDETQSIKSTS